jgi:hypothetical protein
VIPAGLGPLRSQTLPDYQAVVQNQSPTYYFNLDGSLTDSVGGISSFAVAGTGGGFTGDFFGNTDSCRFFVNSSDALTNTDDLIGGGGPVGGDSAATNRGTVVVLFRSLDSTNNTGQRFILSQGNTTANANAFGLFFENNISTDPNSLKLRVGNLTTPILPATNILPAAWYYFAVSYDEARVSGEVKWYLGHPGGVLESGTIDMSLAGVIGDNGTFFLGNRDSLTGGFRSPGNGRVDELAIWNRELTEGEIHSQFETLDRSGEHPLWTAYKLNPDANTNLPNCSYAGYHYGEVPLPSPQTNIINVKDPPFNAIGDGVADDTTALRTALGAVGTNGAVIYFPDGTYNYSGVLFVHSNHTVLRGQSRTNTIIRFTKSLQSGYAHNTSGTSSEWSWTGGMIMFCPKSKNTYLAGTNDIGASWNDSWTVGSQITTITGTHLRGSRTITVSSGSGLSAGQWVLIRVDNAADLSLLKHYCGDEAWAENYDWSTTNSASVLPASRSAIHWPVQIASLSNTTITLRQPLRTDVRAAWNPRIRAMGDFIQECGIENLTIQLARDYEYIYATHHHTEPGWNGPWLNNAVNCFVRGVTVVDPDNGFLLSAVKNVTMTDVRLDYSAPNRQAHHHGTVTRASTHDCLWENFQIATSPRHGIEVESFSAGNVWSRGTMDYGTFDSHKALPYECIRTEITVNNSGTAGGSSDAGPRMGARFVHWNVHVTTNRNHMIGEADIMPLGAVIGVRGCAINDTVHPIYGDSLCRVDLSGLTGAEPNPANLYEAQRDLRIVIPVPATILGLGFTNGIATLGITGTPGQSYRIQGSTTLPAISWIDLGTNFAGTNGLFEFSDPAASQYATRYYRVVHP